MVQITELKQISDRDASVYLENFVNDGSPSGFTTQNAVLGEFAPGRSDAVTLAICRVPPDRCFSRHTDHLVGRGVRTLAEDDLIPLHPLVPIGPGCELVDQRMDGYITAGGRTFIADNAWGLSYVKLHYPGVLGRVARHLTIRKAIAGLEVSDALLHRQSGGMTRFIFLEEHFVAGMLGPGDSIDDGSYAYIDRRFSPSGRMGTENLLLIPWFSLFGSDARSLGDDSLIAQLHRIAGPTNSLGWLVENFLRPVVSAYLYATFVAGLMPEVNAQNLLLAIDRGTGTTQFPVFRDLSRVEKLLHIDPTLASMVSCPYKMLDGRADLDNAMTRHTFSFDFKLGRYVIEPLLNCLVGLVGGDAASWRAEVSAALGRLLDDHEPGVRRWLPRGRNVKGHPPMILTEARPYIDVGPPTID